MDVQLFLPFAVLNRAAVNMDAHVFVGTYVFLCILTLLLITMSTSYLEPLD